MFLTTYHYVTKWLSLAPLIGPEHFRLCPQCSFIVFGLKPYIRVDNSSQSLGGY